ncbi:hypothetical protein ACVWZX_003878 [Deinococcus sp. UYEF24]
MRYRTEVYQQGTDELVADLGSWESKQTAQMVCVAFQRAPLFWEQPLVGIWQAESTPYWYKIVAVTGLR